MEDLETLPLWDKFIAGCADQKAIVEEANGEVDLNVIPMRRKIETHLSC